MDEKILCRKGNLLISFYELYPKSWTLKKVHDSSLLCIFPLIPLYHGNNDKSEVREMRKMLFNELQMKQLEEMKIW